MIYTRKYRTKKGVGHVVIYIYIAILGIYVFLFFLSWKEEGRNPFYKMAACIFRGQQRRSHKIAGRKNGWKRELSQRQLAEKLKTLQPTDGVQSQIRGYYLSQYSTILMVIFAGNLVCLAIWASAHSSPLLMDGSYIGRNPYGKGDIPVELAAQIEGGEEEIFEYVVKERKYTKEEAEALYQQAAWCLPEAIRGRNDSLEDVREDLKLVTHMEGYPFEISWESSSYSLLNSDGTIGNTDLTEGVIVTLTAHFRYEEWTWDHVLYVQVNPVVYTHKQMLRKEIEYGLHKQEEHTKNTGTMVFPEQIESGTVVWREIIEDGSGYLLMLILIAACVLYWGRGREVDRQLEQRKRELMLDYPEIVNKLSLYMGAGMTIRNAFAKMGEDYKKQSKERRRYVYEEILITCYELQSGRSEREAYDHFGKRCQVQAYMKLSTLLSQNIRKGSNDLLYVLRKEADNAFEERKSLAKKLGEEAGTKLLLPMMMMLCIVMVIIMIPAYFSFMV